MNFYSHFMKKRREAYLGLQLPVHVLRPEVAHRPQEHAVELRPLLRELGQDLADVHPTAAHQPLTFRMRIMTLLNARLCLRYL